MTTEHSRITLDPAVLAGKPVIRGTRLSVEFVIGLMADGWKEADIMTNYPGITHDDVIACLAYARDTLSSEKVFATAPRQASSAVPRRRPYSGNTAMMRQLKSSCLTTTARRPARCVRAGAANPSRHPPA
jgi:uncharacterized protein (DUF433 family)